MELSLLDGLSPADREELIGACSRRTFARRQPLFHFGDTNDGMYVVVQGRVVVRVPTAGGEVASLVVIGPGQSVGEQSLLFDEGRRSATAEALDRVEALHLSRARFVELRRDHRWFEEWIVRLLALRVLRLTDQLVEALYVPATKRVLRRVADTAAMYGDGSVPLTQDELASLAGSTRHTANRALRAAAGVGAIELLRGRVSVVDLAALQKMGE